MDHATDTSGDARRWDAAYEWKAVALMTLGFGLVGLDRWVLADLAAMRSSTMLGDLQLQPQQIGTLVAALGIAWGLSSLFMGHLSDVWGRKRVVVPSLILFSLLSACSGVAASFAAMFAVRAMMGVFEGTYCPSSFAVVAEASHPKRRGFNMGFQQSAFALIGLGFGPAIAAYLLDYVSWRWVFAIVGVPGLIVALLAARTVREPETILARRRAKASGSAAAVAAARAPRLSPAAVFSHRNVPLGMVAMMCAMCGIFVLAAFIPSYLTGYLKLDDKVAAGITSAIGFGGFLGQWWLAAASDWLGRRTMALAGFGVGALFLLAFMQLDAASGGLVLFAVLFVAAGFAFGLLSLISGPIAAEAAPLGMIGGVIGSIAMIGEVFGGGVAPGVAGYIAQHYGIEHVLWLALGGLTAGILVSLFFKETAPRFVKVGKGDESALDVFEDEHPEGMAHG